MYDLNNDFNIDVEETQQDKAGKLAALNVDLAIKQDALNEAKNNLYLAMTDHVSYLSNIVKAKRELLEIHISCLNVTKSILEVN